MRIVFVALLFLVLLKAIVYGNQCMTIFDDCKQCVKTVGCGWCPAGFCMSTNETLISCDTNLVSSLLSCPIQTNESPLDKDLRQLNSYQINIDRNALCSSQINCYSCLANHCVWLPKRIGAARGTCLAPYRIEQAPHDLKFCDINCGAACF